MEHGFFSALLQNGLLLAAFGWLLKTLVSDKLKTIGTDINDLKKWRKEDSEKMHGIDNRVVRIEEWRANMAAEGTNLGRRAMDRCPIPDCPHESHR